MTTRSSPPSTLRIAGAGPAGLSAAISLARAGHRVELHEAKSDVGKRFIGDLQIIENASDQERVPEFLARIGIETNFYFRPVTEAAFLDARGTVRRIRARHPYGYFIRRGPFEGTLDSGLFEQAKALGVDVHFNSRLPISEADIAATGPASPDGLAKEITFACDHDEIIEVRFDHNTSPGGYSYLFVIDGLATFGCAIVADFKKIDAYYDRTLAEALRRHGITVPPDARTGYSYMNFHLKEHARAGEARLAGEAAGFQDYLFGLGIRYALTTGNLAARSIIENRDYDDLWKETLGRKQQTSLVNRFLYERGGNFGLSIFVRRAAMARDFHRYLGSWYRDSWWKRALVPLVRRHWKHEGRCLHKPEDHWCRSRDTEIRVPPLGPATSHEP